MDFLEVLKSVIQPINLLMMNVGMAAGIIIGVLPGLGVLLAVTVLLPFTFGMGSLPGIFLLLGAYCGSCYGGSVSAILINTPGTPNAVCTAMDGYPMSQQGRTMDALMVALTGSAIGGIVSCFALILFAPMIAKQALKFGGAEFFSLALFGICVVTSTTGKNVFKAFAMGGIGLMLSTIGMDVIDGTTRFSFGRTELLGGISIAVAALGLFAISEIMIKGMKSQHGQALQANLSKSTLRWRDYFKYGKTIISSALIGIGIGAIPGTGGAIASFLSYNLAKSTSKHPETFGKGEVEGIFAAETANNATTSAAMIPLLTLGIPGDIAVAVLLGALMMQGITVGPELFTTNKDWVWTLMIGLILVNVMMYLQGRFFTKAFFKVSQVPPIVIIPCVMIFVMLGGYAINNRMFDIIIIMVVGFVAYWLVRFEFPIAPLPIGLVLGKIAEANMRKALLISKGSISIFFERPISLAFLIIAVISLVAPLVSQAISNRKKAAAASELAE